MSNFFSGMSKFFIELINIIKNFFINIWNGLIGILSRFLPEGVALAFAILLTAALLIFIFRLIIGDKNK